MSVGKEGRVYMALSAAGLLMMLCLPFIGGKGELHPWQRGLVAVLLLICYVAGAVMAIRPGLARGSADISGQEEKARPPPFRSFAGHHPECPAFADHTLSFRGKRFCAGCAGLAAGCLLSVPLVPILFIDLPGECGAALLVVGTVIVGANLIEWPHGAWGVRSHVLLNALLPPSFCLMAIGALSVSGHFINGIWAVLLGLLWMETRKVVSKHRHASICSLCPEACKSYLP